MSCFGQPIQYSQPCCHARSSRRRLSSGTRLMMWSMPCRVPTWPMTRTLCPPATVNTLLDCPGRLGRLGGETCAVAGKPVRRAL